MSARAGTLRWTAVELKARRERGAAAAARATLRDSMITNRVEESLPGENEGKLDGDQEKKDRKARNESFVISECGIMRERERDNGKRGRGGLRVGGSENGEEDDEESTDKSELALAVKVNAWRQRDREDLQKQQQVRLERTEG